MELGQGIVLKVLYGLQKYFANLYILIGIKFLFWSISKATIQSFLWNVNVCNLLVKVVPPSFYKFKSWKLNLKGYKLQLWSKK
jgi:hypothetical protein